MLETLSIFWQKPASTHCYHFTGRWRSGSCNCWCCSSRISGRHLHVVLHAPSVVFAHLENFFHEHLNVGVILGVFVSGNTPMLRTLIVLALESCFSWLISLRFMIQMIVAVDCTQLLSCFEGLYLLWKKKHILQFALSSWQFWQFYFFIYFFFCDLWSNISRI